MNTLPSFPSESSVISVDTNTPAMGHGVRQRDKMDLSSHKLNQGFKITTTTKSPTPFDFIVPFSIDIFYFLYNSEGFEM